MTWKATTRMIFLGIFLSSCEKKLHVHTHTAFPFSLLFGGAQSLSTGSSSNHYTCLLMHFRCFLVPKNQSPTFLTWNWGLWGPIQTVGKSSVVTGNVSIYFNTYLKVDQCVKLFILQIFWRACYVPGSALGVWYTSVNEIHKRIHAL